MSTATNMISRFDELPTDYEGLVAIFMPRPIRDEVDADNATDLIDLMAGHELTRDQEDFLEIIANLVDAFEADEVRQWLGELSPIEILNALLKENDMNASELGWLLGDRSLGSRILTGKRELSKEHIRRLSSRFNVEASLFLS